MSLVICRRWTPGRVWKPPASPAIYLAQDGPLGANAYAHPCRAIATDRPGTAHTRPARLPACRAPRPARLSRTRCAGVPIGALHDRRALLREGRAPWNNTPRSQAGAAGSRTDDEGAPSAAAAAGGGTTGTHMRPEMPRGGTAVRSARLEVLLQDRQALGLLAVVGHHGARAANHLARLALGVDLAQTCRGGGRVRGHYVRAPARPSGWYCCCPGPRPTRSAGAECRLR